MDSIPQYNKNRHNPEGITYKHHLLKPILEVTYGCIVYQEQVMQIFRELAGYSLGKADLVRRAMSKKKFDVMEKERQNFIYGSDECDGAVKRGVDEKTANEVFDQMLSFASYAFNKSHAAAYAFVSYKTAYLKCHYPVEFMAALMTSVLENTDKLISYVSACGEMGIKVLPPDISKSDMGFTVDGNNIRFGLLAIKNLGKGVIASIIKSRENVGEFRSFYDFCKRLCGKDFNKKSIESLIKSGALDSLEYNRRQMLEGYNEILDSIEAENKRTMFGQTNLFAMESSFSPQQSEITLAPKAEFASDIILKFEKETVGMFISGHPITPFSSLIKKNKYVTTGELFDGSGRYYDGQKVSVLGVITQIKQKNTRSNRSMAYITLGEIEVLVFPNILAKYESMLFEYKVDDKKSIVVINGTLDLKDEGDAKLICDGLMYAEDFDKPKPKEKRLFLKVPSEDSYEYNSILNILANSDRGEYKVIVRIADTNKLLKLSDSYSTDCNYILLSNIRSILDDDCIAFRN